MSRTSRTGLGPVPRALIMVVAGCLAFAWWQSRTPQIVPATDALGQPIACQPPPIGVAPMPVQLDSLLERRVFQLGALQAKVRAGFAVEATVLGTERYRTGPEAEVSPLDLALGWGPMADPSVYGALDISQSGRWYYYRWGPGDPPIPAEAIGDHSSNMHMIPSTPAIAETLLDVERGQKVRLLGWLVDVEYPNGGRWTTSLSRHDRGGGACEIVYVCEARVSP